jgi:ATP-dependent DNA helicase RecG
MPISLQTDVRMVKGVGPQRAELLAKRGIFTLEDLLNYLPFRYEDRIRFSTIKEVVPGGVYTLRVKVLSGQAVRGMYGRDAIYHLLVQDATGSLPANFFTANIWKIASSPASPSSFTAKWKSTASAPRAARWSIRTWKFSAVKSWTPPKWAASSQFTKPSALSARARFAAPCTPVQLIPPDLPDVLPAALRDKLKLPTRSNALIQTHFPDAGESLELLNIFRSPAQQRLIFEEFFRYQLSIALDRQTTRRENAIPFRLREEKIRAALKRILPFKPTNAQKTRALRNRRRPRKAFPMNRLLQGDVGSGKTIVALQAAVIAIENDTQAAIMAPTEILAVQHYLGARRILEPAGYRVELLISGMKFSDKSAALERLRTGESHLAVGTHALIEDNVKFAKLAFVAIDEQHRFGVLQRKRLMDKAAATVTRRTSSFSPPRPFRAP